MSNSEVFLDCVAACKAMDVERVLSFYTPTSTWHNMPAPPVQGLDAIRNMLQEFFKACSEVNWEILSIAESPTGVVLTERVDRFRINGKWVGLPVMGAVEIENGKIRSWREYYDSRHMEGVFASP